MKDLSNELPERIFGICDSDFDHLMNAAELHTTYSVFVTDTHDAEMMMLTSPSLNNFIIEYANPEKLNFLEQNLLSLSFNAAYYLGCIRFINNAENLNINFKGLNFNKFIEITTDNITLNKESLLNELISRSKSIKDFATKNYIEQRANDLMVKNECKMQVCSGHDTTNIISIFFRQNKISLDTKMEHRKVESSLRLGFNMEHFSKTKLFERIKEFLSRSNVELTN